jgi:hypothetical protein
MLAKDTLVGNMLAEDMIVGVGVSSGWGYSPSLERTRLRKAVQRLGMVVGEERTQGMIEMSIATAMS